MKVQSELVVCSTINPEGKRLLVEVTTLMLLPTIFYDASEPLSDEVQLADEWLTIIGGKLYRVNKIPEERVTHASTLDNMAFFEVTVNWDDLEVKPKEKSQ